MNPNFLNGVPNTDDSAVQSLHKINAVLSNRGTPTDKSGTITSGGTAQDVAAANPARQFLVFQNTSDTDMRISVTGTPTATVGILCPANGGGYEWNTPGFIPTSTLKVFCATTGKAFTCNEG